VLAHSLGLRVEYRRLTTLASEIDLVAEATADTDLPFFPEYARFLLVECKNWASPLGAKGVRDFCGKMRDTKVRLGLIFAKSGITGRERRVAEGVIANNFQRDGSIVVVITLADVRAVAAGE